MMTLVSTRVCTMLRRRLRHMHAFSAQIHSAAALQRHAQNPTTTMFRNKHLRKPTVTTLDAASHACTTKNCLSQRGRPVQSSRGDHAPRSLPRDRRCPCQTACMQSSPALPRLEWPRDLHVRVPHMHCSPACTTGFQKFQLANNCAAHFCEHKRSLPDGIGSVGGRRPGPFSGGSIVCVNGAWLPCMRTVTICSAAESMQVLHQRSSAAWCAYWSSSCSFMF